MTSEIKKKVEARVAAEKAADPETEKPCLEHNWTKDKSEGDVLAAVARVLNEYRRVSGELRKMQSPEEAETDENDLDGKFKTKPGTFLSDDTIKSYRKQLAGKISKLRGSSRKSVIDYVRSCTDKRMVIDGKELDTQPWLLTLANGVLDLKTGVLRDGRPEDYLTCASPTEWKGLDEPCPNFEKFISEILGDKQEMVDYTL